MQDWSIPLALATTAFLTLVVWRVRPAVPWGRDRGARRVALDAARAAIESASDDRVRALALCDAADIVGKRVVGAANAKGYFLRAIRADPSSVEVVRRATTGLATRPRALESFLWRHLGASAWTGASVAAVRESLDALRLLYEGRLKNTVRARAFARARDSLGERKD
jgi:hypothetical protein